VGGSIFAVLEALRRRIPRAVVALVMVFLAQVSLAATLYPGGTWLHRRRVGHDLWGNFLCDLTQPVALNGQPNALGARFGAAAMLTFTVALALVWQHFPPLLQTRAPRLGRTIAVVGALGCGALVAVPCTPSLRFGRIHAAVVFVAVGSCLGALGTATHALWRHLGPDTATAPRRGIARVLSVALVAALVLDAGLYAYSLAPGGRILPLLPALQRIATGISLAWMLAVVALRPSTPPAAG